MAGLRSAGNATTVALALAAGCATGGVVDADGGAERGAAPQVEGDAAGTVAVTVAVVATHHARDRLQAGALLAACPLAMLL